MHNFFDAYADQAVELIGADGKIRGINRGIAADGRLRLQTGSGLELHSAAEI